MGCHRVGGVCAAGSASSIDTDDPDPIPSFESPNEGAVQFQFVVVDSSTNAPIKAKIFVGKYEADATPIADTDASTPLSNTAKFVSNSTFDFIVQAPGYGAVFFPGSYGPASFRRMRSPSS